MVNGRSRVENGKPQELLKFDHDIQGLFEVVRKLDAMLWIVPELFLRCRLSYDRCAASYRTICIEIQIPWLAPPPAYIHAIVDRRAGPFKLPVPASTPTYLPAPCCRQTRLHRHSCRAVLT